MLLLDDFDYELPPAAIARYPPAQRDGGRLLRLDRKTGALTHHPIVDLPQLLPPGSLLVVNDTRVIPARLLARRATGGSVELLLIERREPRRWSCMLRGAKRLRMGERLTLAAPAGGANAAGGAAAPAVGCVRIVTAPQGGRCEVELEDEAVIEACGAIPLPPYLARPAEASDTQRYQTIFAAAPGAIAAPTAGLHFTPELVARLEASGATLAKVTLHVGAATFLPIRDGDLDAHQVEGERFSIPEATAAAIATARSAGRAVVAVGTTVVRALETTGGAAGQGRTELFIRPGHRFVAVDALLTNFHLPRSTLLLLVCALAGRERVLAAYRAAVAAGYRFYSYGDAMLIV
ncbi:MAG: tRNA preQ1(34) S-adenosylmethionine ribosyltransferase-isomerase QueA [Proteobacteria bacterium]|nr:tRNA preQ1(34) S-adenosylmethionine ribosyltransferase-isomerase QueA [Pseudomonadota bacterium]